MRKCFNNYCVEGYESEWVDDGTEEGYYITTNDICDTCDGTGEVGEGCYCMAFERNECCCGCDWDDTLYFQKQ